jgi:mediator of RNA polymerase II transcription subunit 9
MVIKQLLAALLSRNSGPLIEKLADSYVMRRAAQMVVSVFYKTKAITQENKLDDADQWKVLLKKFANRFQQNIAEEMEKAKKEIESKRK